MTIGGGTHLVPALEVGGTHVAGALVDLPGRRLVAASLRREALGTNGSADEILSAIAGCARAVLTAAAPAGVGRGATLGVAIPGPFDYQRGIGGFTGVGKFEALNGVDVRGALLEDLRPAVAEIVFLNDAEAFVIGEHLAGAGRGHDRVVGVTLGTGVGSAFLEQGRIVDDDPRVPPKGFVHLLTIDGRPLEDAVSRRAMLRRLAELGGGVAPDADVRELAVLARGGDPVALEVFRGALEALGRALGPWLVSFGAGVLVVGGSMARSWDLIEGPLTAGLAAADPALADLAVRPAENLDDAGLLGAASRASERPSATVPRGATLVGEPGEPSAATPLSRAEGGSDRDGMVV